MGTSPATTKPGREKAYNLSDVHTTKVSLSTEKDGKTFTQDSVEYTVSNIAEALAVMGNSDDALFAFLSDAFSTYAQRNDRQKLYQKAQGPAKLIVSMAKDNIKMFGDTPEAAIDATFAIGLSRGTWDQAYINANRATLLAKLKGGDDSEDETAQ